MIISALWVLEQEAKAFRWLRQPGTFGEDAPGGKDWSDMNSFEQLFLASAATGWAMGHFALAAQPYTRIFGYAAKEDLFLRELALHSPRSLGGKGIPAGFTFGLRGFKPTWLSASVGRKATAKIASRFVPYLGWALLAIDLWHVGKWIGERTS